MQCEIKPKIIHSKSFDPWFNLSLEEHLLFNVEPDEIILYLWQNDKAVVIGRNQNAWKECEWEKLAEESGKLARRLSGGGAVYHDLGNLNFTFIMNKSSYDIKKQESVIIEALKALNIEAAFSGRNDMLINGRKFSGHAYYSSGGNAYHHGTLMVSSDLEKLSRYLNPSEQKIQSKAVASVRSRVINISEANNTVTISILKKSMEDSFQNIYGAVCSNSFYEEEADSLQQLYKKYSSWEWRFGDSPRFDITLVNKFPWGELEMNFTLRKGKIIDIKVYTDAMKVELFDQFTAAIKDTQFNKKGLIDRAKGSIADETIKKDFVSWADSLKI